MALHLHKQIPLSACALYICAFFFSVSAHSQIEPSSARKSSLKQARAGFEKRNCKQVIHLLNEKDFTKDFEDESEFIDRYHMLGVCYFQAGDKKNTEIELNELLFINPNFELDPFITPPPLLELFNQLKNSIKEKSKELELAKEKAVDKPSMVGKNFAYKKTSIIPAFSPFGLGQFTNKETAKGIIVAAAQVSMLSANIGCYWWKRSLVDTQGTSATLEQYNLAQTLQFVALGSFLAIYAYSVADAIWNRSFEMKEIPANNTIEIATEAFLQEFKKAKNNFSTF